MTRWEVGGLLAIAIAAIAGLRVDALPFTAACAIAATVLLAAIVLGLTRAPPSRHGAALLLLLGGEVALLGLFPAAWPCDIACRAGEEWATLFGVPTLVWCAGATLLTALLLWISRDPASPRGGAFAGEIAVRGCAGASCYFLAIAFQLSLPCRHCLAVHLPILAGTALLFRGALSPSWARNGALLAGAVLTRQLFMADLERARPRRPVLTAQVGANGKIQLDADETDDADPERVAAAMPPIDFDLLSAVDRGRRLGAATAKLRVELVISFNCGHCMEAFGPLLDAVAPLCVEDKAELVVHLLHARKDPASRELSKLAFAAGRDGRFRERVAAIFAARVAALKGNGAQKGDMAEAVQRVLARDALTIERLKAAPGMAAEFAWVAAQGFVFDQLLQGEEEAHKRLGSSGELPRLFLVDPVDDRVLETLSNEATPAQLAAAVRRHLAQ